MRLRRAFQARKAEVRAEKRRLLGLLGQAEKSSRLLNFPHGSHQRADFNTKLNLNLNRFIKANEFRNRKLQVQKKLKEFVSSEDDEERRRSLRVQKAGEEIEDLKMRRRYHQIKLKLFYLDLLRTLTGPAAHKLTAPEVVRRLWRIKGDANCSERDPEPLRPGTPALHVRLHRGAGVFAAGNGDGGGRDQAAKNAVFGNGPHTPGEAGFAVADQGPLGGDPPEAAPNEGVLTRKTRPRQFRRTSCRGRATRRRSVRRRKASGSRTETCSERGSC